MTQHGGAWPDAEGEVLFRWQPECECQTCKEQRAAANAHQLEGFARLGRRFADARGDAERLEYLREGTALALFAWLPIIPPEVH